MLRKLLFILSFAICFISKGAEKPNIIWIFAEDTSPWMGCYGYEANKGATPNIDSIAESGVIFRRAFVPAPVCSACRSAMMVGQNQIRFGAHEHRSSRSEHKLYLPKGYKILPEIMADNGYNTFNIGKTDYNFEWDVNKAYTLKLKSKTDFWKQVKSKQPFFGQIQTGGGKNNTKKFPKDRKVNPADVKVPADYPQNQLYKEVVAEHLDSIRMDDDLIGKILDGLKKSGMQENTIIVYFSDHGANHLLRHKQMTTEGGLHVPFVIMGPDRYIKGAKERNELINMLDLTATTLAWAGIEKPEWYEGQNLFSDNYSKREFVAAGKDRLDHTIDRVRSIRTEKFRYVKNFKTDRIFLQPQYRDRNEPTKMLHSMYQSGELPTKLKEIYFGERPDEELYDVSVDPHMINNLVKDPSYKAELERHRKLLDDWLAKGDKGIGEESVTAMKYNGEGKKWGEGVNPEYEVYREDSDGDGLSDKWESLNKRDPHDGLLQFEFNCGGWQTEGWKAQGIKSNIAGFLGYLDFDLSGSEDSIFREGLKIKATVKDKSLNVRIKSSENISLSFNANKQEISSAAVKAGEFQEISIPLNSKWNGEINEVSISFKGNAGVKIEIDYVKIAR